MKLKKIFQAYKLKLDAVFDKEKLSNESKEILNNPAFVRALEEMRIDVINQWASSKDRGVEDREKLFISLLAVNSVEQTLKKYIINNTIEKQLNKGKEVW